MRLKAWHKILIFLFAIVVFLRLTSNPAAERAYYSDDMNYPLVIAHQGGDEVWPGDTLFAYQNAAKLGVDVLEMDIHSIISKLRGRQAKRFAVGARVD